MADDAPGIGDAVSNTAGDAPDALAIPPGTDSTDGGRWVAAAAFNHPVAAHIARVKLEFGGFPCYLDNELFVSTVWMYAIATGGVKLMVREADLPAARESLREKAPHAPYARVGAGTFDPDREVACPHCGSRDVAPDRPWKRLIATSLLMAAAEGVGIIFVWLWIPLVVGVALRSAVSLPWKCGSCDHYWWGRVHAKGFDVLARPPDAPAAPLPPPVPVLAVTPPPATAR